MNFDDRLPVDAVKVLIDQHGVWQVLRAVSRAALGRRAMIEVRGIEHLSDHLRRDIGLSPRGTVERQAGYE